MVGHRKTNQLRRGPGSAKAAASGGAKKNAAAKTGSAKLKGGAKSGRARQRTRKSGKSRVNFPLLAALFTLLLLGSAGVFWLFNSAGPDPRAPAQGRPTIQNDAQKPQTEGKTGTAPPHAQGGAPSGRSEGKVPELPAPQPVSSGGYTDSASAPPPATPEVADWGGSEMEQKTWRIDAYLLGLLNSGGCAGSIRILEVERRIRPNNSYPFQKLWIDLPESSVYYANPADFGSDIARGLREMQMGAELSSPAANQYVLSVDGLVTHEIFLHFVKEENVASASGPKDLPAPAGTAAAPQPPPASSPSAIQAPSPASGRNVSGTGLLAIVIDDIGENLPAAHSLAALDFPVTFAIWPKAGNARKCAEIGHARGLEIMIHQPMEPLGYPRVNPGPGAVYAEMDPREIIALVQENLSLVPYATGLNNHMGSRFTQNRRGVEAVLTALQGSKLFVLDSLTHGGSVFYSAARAAGFACQRRDIFLDVSQDKTAILHQLYKAERLALSQGYAVAIGHPLPGTLAALQEWEKTRNKNLKVVRVQDLLQFERED